MGAAVSSTTSAVLPSALVAVFARMYSWIFAMSMYWSPVVGMSDSIRALCCTLLTGRYSTILDFSMLVCVGVTVSRSNSDFPHSHDEALTKAIIAAAAAAATLVVANQKYLYYHHHLRFSANGYFSS